MIVSGRYRGAQPESVLVKGRAGDRELSFRVPVVAEQQQPRPAIAQVWARAKIADLADRATYVEDLAPLIEGIKETALRFGMVSKFTAFVAVDSSRKTEGDHGVSVAQPVPVPEGVRYETSVPE